LRKTESRSESGHSIGKENTMPQSPHNRIAEFHNLAAHAHAAAAVAHGKGDHMAAHELTQKAHEQSMNVHKLAEELATKNAKPSKA
jgi:hypothetical protein